MRILFLMRGAPGAGKSTFIQNNELGQYSLGADQIRLLIQSPVLDINGNLSISQSNEKKVWQLLFAMLEDRMIRGEFTIIDATNSKAIEINRYKELCDKYRYRIVLIDFTDIPIDVVKSRNAQRDEFKRVPEHVIDNMYSRFETQKVPSGVTVIKPDQFWDTVRSLYQIRDFSAYKKIHHIGDIHGCFTPLMEYFNQQNGMKDDELYIFLGDYFDHGIENGEVAKFLLSIYTKPNVILLTGNHEDHLYRFANDIEGVSTEFELLTKPQLINANLDKKELRKLYRKFGQLAFYYYGTSSNKPGKVVLVTHGGLSTLPDHFAFIATEQIIKGVGAYGDMEQVNNSFVANTGKNAYQIHGHRNNSSSPVQINERCYNLCGGAEFGGALRILTLDIENGFIPYEIINTVYNKDKFTKKTEVDSDITIDAMVALLKDSKHVQEKRFGSISSFNFTRDVFNNKIWDSLTVKARGLFINTNVFKIVARSYDKFFNLNEVTATKLQTLQNSLQYPLHGYLKYNGFLGIVGYDEETDSLLITSKSSPNGSHSDYFRAIFESKVKDKDALKNYLKENELSFIFEAIDPVNDPHIIEYKDADIILLDAIYRTLEYKKLPYEELVAVANQFGLKVKELAFVFNNWNEFYKANEQFQLPDYKYNGEYIEGFAMEDASGFMFKLKLKYYNVWKFMRGVKDSVGRFGNIRSTSALTTKEMNDFYGYIRSLPREDLQQDIIRLRNSFYAQQAKGYDPAA